VPVVAVIMGLKEPQALAGAQLQVTPAESFVVAATVAVPEVDKVIGGAWEI